MDLTNLFRDLPESLPEEGFQTLVESGNVRIERIVSAGHASPPGYWYDQPQSEFVVLLQGSAQLQIEGEDQPRVLEPGDFVNLPAHQKHRVESTDPHVKTVWLAFHYGS
ncbi:Cupin domain protein [Bremerella volcania]|uniref:Cupin domain protein n=1 Tax=Bremerella volcania TaxID=2527984 RepID=A0A518CDY8_9BACT|nr:cupin domain-containing protein [Bremerella volcania]QDU77440.1 Cupin domain protein [Bremerella volcania]